MPFNGSGTFVRQYDWTNDANTDINIEAARMDIEDDGFAGGLSTCITKDGQTTITANLPMSGFRHTGVGAATARTQYGLVSAIQDGTYIYGTGAAGTDTITMTIPLSLAAYTAGQVFFFVAAGTNTGATTLNINSLGAKAIQKNGAALVAGDITANDGVAVMYDGTQFQMLTPARTPVLTAGGIATAALANSAVTTAKINDAAVTLAKMDNINATSNMKVIGRTTASNGVPELINILDEDNMSSNSATSLASQQSIKAYVAITTRGDIIAGNSSGIPARLALGAVGKVLKSNGTDVVYDFPFTVVLKGTDETKSGSATITDDAELLFTMDASGTYYIEMDIMGSGAGITLHYDINGSAAATSIKSFIEIIGEALGAAADTQITAYASDFTLGSINGDFKIRFSGVIVNSSSSSTVKFRWRGVGANTTIYAGSTLKYMKIA